jgi:N-methylhydantoinase B
MNQYVEFPYVDGTISCIGDRERFGPPGIFGGDDGATAGLVINHQTEQERNIGIFSVNEPANAGESITFWSAGGGGYGDPMDREPAHVVRDVQDDYVSITAAREQYGVVITEVDRRLLQYEIDQAATDALRKEMRAARS